MDHKGIALGFISTALGAMITILYKPMMMQGMPALTIALIESCVVAVFLTIICKPWRILRCSKRILYPVFTAGLCQAIGAMSFFVGLSHLDAVTFSFLTRNQAVFSIVFGYFFLNERHELGTWMFITFAILGSFILCYAEIGSLNIAGILFAISFCISFGVRNFILRKYWRIPVLINLFYGYVMCIIFLLPVAIFSTTYQFHAISYTELVQIALISIVASLGTLVFFQLALRYSAISVISPIRLFSPFMIAIYFGWEIGYKYAPTKVLGMLIMGIAILTLIYTSKQPRKVSQ